MHCSAVWATVAKEKIVAYYIDSDMQEIVFMQITNVLSPLEALIIALVLFQVNIATVAMTTSIPLTLFHMGSFG